VTAVGGVDSRSVVGDGPRLFDIGAAVNYLREIGATAATKNFVRGLIATGQINHIRIGRKYYVSREALDTWIVKRQRRAQ